MSGNIPPGMDPEMNEQIDSDVFPEPAGGLP